MARFRSEVESVERVLKLTIVIDEERGMLEVLIVVELGREQHDESCEVHSKQSD